MNVLSFVSFILLVLWIGYYSFFQQSLFLDSLLKSNKGYFSAQNQLEEKAALEEFRNLKAKVIFPSPPARKKTKKPKKSFRRQAYCECAKIDLSFMQEKKNIQLDSSYQLLEVLLQKNYAPLFSEVSIKNFLCSLHWAIQKQPKDQIFRWENLEFTDKKLQTLFYRIWKGTKFYEKNSYGFLPLSCFVKMEPGSKICLPCISFELLEVVSGEERAKTLWSKKEKFLERLEVTAEEVFFSNLANSSYQDLVCFSHKTQKEPVWICGRDEKTEIEIKIPQYLRDKRRMLSRKS